VAATDNKKGGGLNIRVFGLPSFLLGGYMSQLEVLVAEQSRQKAECKACNKWECGYCAVPKIELNRKIEKIKGGLL